MLIKVKQDVCLLFFSESLINVTECLKVAKQFEIRIVVYTFNSCIICLFKTDLPWSWSKPLNRHGVYYGEPNKSCIMENPFKSKYYGEVEMLSLIHI